jgi:2,3-bisphosphoglycerate-independent phosphoglycerate mutase
MANPLVLLIIDDLGVESPLSDNVFFPAQTPYLDYLVQTFPAGLLRAEGEAVGLPRAAPGNAAAGYLTLGSGQTLYQSALKARLHFTKQNLAKNPVLRKHFQKLKDTGGAFHLVGFISNDEAHPKPAHYKALLRAAKEAGVSRIFIHAILNSTFSPSALRELLSLSLVSSPPFVQVASLSGCFFAADETLHDERIELTLNAMRGKSIQYRFSSWEEAIASFKKQNISYENIPPTVITSGFGAAARDLALFLDTTHYALRTLAQKYTSRRKALTWVDYGFKDKKVEIIIENEVAKKPLSEVLAQKNVPHLKIFPASNFPLATYFFNGKREGRALKEVWLPVEGSKEVFKKIVSEVINRTYPFIIGSLGRMRDGDHAFSRLNKGVQELSEIILRCNGALLLTSSYGSSAKNVPCIIAAKEFEGHHPWGASGAPPVAHDWSILPLIGSLKDVAPTVLKILGIQKPQSMEGKSLI